ncbi:MAG: PAS domain S-box protein [Deltaproteobacteria bacterium]|nr:PAS domain S-box protein [Deltaproteobacteria bacterium]
MPRPSSTKKEKSGALKTPQKSSKDMGLDVGYQQAIQKLHLSEKLLRASERKYRSLVESIPDIIFALDLNGSITYIGPKWKKILGHDESEVLGKFFIHFAPAEEHSFLTQVFKEARNFKKSVENICWQSHRKDGQIRYFSGSAAPLLDEQGQVVGTMGIARDITEQKKLEEQLLQAQKMESIGNLAGGIAHDFNNLLGGILGYASFVKKKMSPEDPLYHSINSIERTAGQAAELTRQLLGFARRGKYQVKPINCNALIQDLVQFLGRTIDKRITLEVDLNPRLNLIEGDEAQLQQSLINICLNARDAMPSGGILKIVTDNYALSPDHLLIQRGWKEGVYVRITISDNGSGMTQEVQTQIFEPFFTTKEPGRGTGLGLSMVYGIIQNHGGVIDVKSALDQGTTFEILLPSIADIMIQEEVLPSRPIISPKGSETILIVDDEEIIRQLGADILEDVGYKVILASRGEEAIPLYRQKRKDIGLVVLDVVMPGLGGKETFRKLREINPNIKVLLSSGYSTDGEVGEILKEGVSGLIQKPYKDEELIGKVREILDA